MSWTIIDIAERRRVEPFLTHRENRCVAFTSRLLDSNCRVYAYENAGEILGAVLNEPNGFFYPVFVDGLHHNGDIMPFPRLRSTRLYSIMGYDPDVRLFAGLVRHTATDTIRYLLMSRGLDPAPPVIDDPELAIRPARMTDVEALIPIQGRYELEEVLLPGHTLNRESVRRHLHGSIRDQIVIIAEKDGIPVAKAGTNARGRTYDQIGGVYTEPSLRSRGVARSLMARVIEHCRLDGKMTALFVKTDNRPAIALYRRLGYRVDGEFSILYFR